MTCPHCRDAGELFGEGPARRELRRYRRRGAPRDTRRLVEAIRERTGGRAFTLMDVGGGIGAIQHEALAMGATEVLNVDASRSYQAAVADEARSRGTLDRIRFVPGDFVERAEEVGTFDVVTLDRVVCCYPDMPALVAASADRARALYGLVFPREHLVGRLGNRVLNLWFRIRRSAFRVYLHGHGAITATVEGRGFRPVRERTSLLWRMTLFERVSPPPVAPYGTSPGPSPS